MKLNIYQVLALGNFQPKTTIVYFQRQMQHIKHKLLRAE